jgi:O-antigen ligase
MLLALAIIYRQSEDALGSRKALPTRAALGLWIAAIGLGVANRFWSEVMLGYTYENSLYRVTQNTWNWLTLYLLFYLAYSITRKRKILLAAVSGACLSMNAEAMLACYERLQGVGRATAHLDEPNRAGTFFSLAMPLFLVLFLAGKGRMRWMWLGATGVQVAAVFATLSRGAMLGSAISTLFVVVNFMLFARGKMGGKMLFIVLAVCLVNFYPVLVPDRVERRVMKTFGRDVGVSSQLTEESVDSSARNRLQLWRSGILLFKDKPYGWGAFTSISVMERYMGYTKAAHNIYVQILVELGVQGLIAFATFMGAVYVALWGVYRRAREEFLRDLALGLMAALTGALVSTFFVGTFFMIQVTGQFWLLAGAVLGARELEEREEAGSRGGESEGRGLAVSYGAGIR